MDNKKTKLVALTRYLIRYTTDGKRFQTLMDAQGRVTFDAIEDARAHLHTVIDEVSGVMGMTIVPEMYYKKADS